MIVVVDYGMGNLKSVSKALEYIGADVKVSSQVQDIEAASHIVLPGVGSYGSAMNKLIRLELIGILSKEILEVKKPFLGICLGMHLTSLKGFEDGEHIGLGWINSIVKKLELKDSSLKIPHVGWNDVAISVKHELFDGLGDSPDFYFSHSYYMECKASDQIAMKTNYGEEFVAAILHENIFATQFHPEKSQEIGLKLLENFANWKF